MNVKTIDDYKKEIIEPALGIVECCSRCGKRPSLDGLSEGIITCFTCYDKDEVYIGVYCHDDEFYGVIEDDFDWSGFKSKTITRWNKFMLSMKGRWDNEIL